MNPFLIKYMKDAKVSQSSLARMVGCAPSTVYCWLIGRASPRAKMAWKLQKVTGGGVPISSWGWIMQPNGKMFKDEALLNSQVIC